MVTISGETLTYHQLSWRSMLISITWTWSGTRIPSLSLSGITSTCWKTSVRHDLVLSEVLWLIIRPISSCFIPSYTSVLLTQELALKMVLNFFIRITNYLFLELPDMFFLNYNVSLHKEEMNETFVTPNKYHQQQNKWYPQRCFLAHFETHSI